MFDLDSVESCVTQFERYENLNYGTEHGSSR